MNNYVVMICKVSVVFYLIYLSEVSCKVCKKTIGNLININASSQNSKVFAAIFLFFQMEHLGNQTTNCHAFYILLFPNLSKKLKYLSNPTSKWRCLREGIFAFIIIYPQFF